MTEASPPTAQEMIDRLGLRAHPEGGHYRETWRGPPGPGGRPAGTAILFLLAAGERSHWHRVDAAEVWLHHEGDPLHLAVVAAGSAQQVTRLGPASHAESSDDTVPQVVVPPDAWQSAEPAAADVGWSLVSCVVAPGFEFDGFELAPSGWTPADPDTDRTD